MLSYRLLYKVGAWSFITVGAGHLVAHLLLPSSPSRSAVIEAMQGFVIEMPGRSGSIYQYHQGFSLMMGILLVAYGAHAVLFIRSKYIGPTDELPVLILHTTVSAIAVVLSAVFFSPIPIILTTLALVAFSIALAMVWQEVRWSRGRSII